MNFIHKQPTASQVAQVKKGFETGQPVFCRNMHAIMPMVIECKEHSELCHNDKAAVTITNQRGQSAEDVKAYLATAIMAGACPYEVYRLGSDLECNNKEDWAMVTNPEISTSDGKNVEDTEDGRELIKY